MLSWSDSSSELGVVYTRRTKTGQDIVERERRLRSQDERKIFWSGQGGAKSEGGGEAGSRQRAHAAAQISRDEVGVTALGSRHNTLYLGS